MTLEDPRDALFDTTGMTEGLGHRAGRSAVTVLLFSALKIIVTVGSTVVLARLVPPSEQGVLALAMPAVLIATGLAEFGFAQAVVQRDVVSHRLVSTLFWIGMALGGGLSLLVAGLSFPAAVFYEEPQVTAIFLVLAPYVLLSVMTAQYTAILRRQMRIRQIETGHFGATVLGAILAIGAALLGAGYWALAIQILVVEGLNLGWLVVQSRWIPSSPRASNWQSAREAVSFGGYLTADRILSELLRNIQVTLVGRMFGTSEAGLFYRTQNLARLPERRISGPLGGAFLPALSRLQADPQGFRDMFLRVVTRCNIVMMPLGLLMMTCADALTLVLLGRDWLDAAPLLSCFGLLTLAVMPQSTVTWSLIACGKGRTIFRFRLFAVPVSLAAMLIGVQFGLAGLLLGQAAARFAILVPVLCMLAVRHTPLKPGTLLRAITPDAIWALVTGGAMALLRAGLDLPEVAEAALAGSVLLIAMALRIGLTPTLRSDLGKAVRRRRPA